MPDLSTLQSHAITDRINALFRVCKPGHVIFDAFQGFVIVVSNDGEKVMAETLEPQQAFERGVYFTNCAKAAHLQRKSSDADTKTD